MKKEKTLVILAAGSGSRFGGMKQVEPVGPNGEFIMDYSIYSAVKYGITKIVFVIREEYLDLFKSSVGKRWEDKVKIAYCFQDINDIPEGFTVPDERTKPWGTSHAIYAARNEIEGNIGVITADDFYGDHGMRELVNSLDNDDYSVIGYKLADTLSPNGAVKRGVVISENGIVKKIIESSCELDGDMVKCTPITSATTETFRVPKDNSVSMLMYGFTKELFDKVGSVMKRDFEANKDHLDTYEMLLPDILTESIEEGKVIRDIPTDSVWMGMTYREDAQAVKDFILKEIENGVYPEKI